jgi:hypothetical protein
LLVSGLRTPADGRSKGDRAYRRVLGGSDLAILTTGEVGAASNSLQLSLPEMPAPPRKRHLGAQQRRALQLLACSRFGGTETAMFLNGFARQTLVRLILAGLATTERENLKLKASLSAASGSLRPVDGRSKVN